MWWIIAGLLMIAVAITALALVRLRGATRALARCRQWQIVPGRVIDCSIREVSVEEVGPQYIPIVIYQYAIEEKQYQSEQLAIGDHTQYSLRRHAERRLARYSPGDAVEVHDNPANPANALLECRAPMIPLYRAVLVLLWLITVAGIALLLFLPGVAGPEPFLSLP